jgi:hypothetical protein
MRHRRKGWATRKILQRSIGWFGRAGNLPTRPELELVGRLFLAWVVSGVDVVKLERRHPVDLNNDLSVGHRVVVHAWIHKRKTTRRESHHFAFFKVIPHADFEIPRDHGDIFAMGVPMRGNFVAVRHLQANGEIPGGCCRVTLNDCQLSACGHKIGRRSIRNLGGRKRILRRHPHSREHACRKQDQSEHMFHNSPLF